MTTLPFYQLPLASITFGNVIFSNYIIEDFDYDEDSLENCFSGMDFGYIHAAVIERGGFKDGELYIYDELYGKNWTNTDFIQSANEYFGEDHYWPITADSAEPDRIEEWQRAGWNVTPAKKGPGSLKFGIDFMTRQRIHIHKTRCPAMAREIQSFQRKVGKDGEPLEGQFVEINDDCIAAVRYGTESLWQIMDIDGYLGGAWDDFGEQVSALDYLGL